VFIFDECHRSQFGENHKSIKKFFPKSQLFGFTGTPIFDLNSSYTQVDGTDGSFKTTDDVFEKEKASFKTTKDIFEKELHAYTITNAIDDRNVLSFHIDYFGEGHNSKKQKSESLPTDAVVKEILAKHDAVTNHRRFNAVLATASINHAIDYVEEFKIQQEQQQVEDQNFTPLNIACVFSPPAQRGAKDKTNSDNSNVDKNSKDIKQLQEDLPQEKADNQVEPEKKKEALKEIIANYNQQYGTNHKINEFDLYYQDVQQRIKDQKYSNAGFPHKKKIDIVIVVDMLLTGFDSKFLNTLYVDKNLKYHGLIQAFSRTNRVLNDSKPWGNILDFRGQETEVNAAIELFSGAAKNRAKEIWLVDSSPVAVKNYQKSIETLDTFMQGKGLDCSPSEVANLKGDIAKAEFINHFKAVQKLNTQIEQYTELSDEEQQHIETALSIEDLRGFKSAYLEIAKDLKRKQDKDGEGIEIEVQQLDFELVIFASAVIDYDFIMGLIAKSTQDSN
ncbi:type I restriction endonuclease subunit R, EcoR124 family, partial [Bathymodiolus platifrons methanotrophic gill symbiont]|uniref:type I restriction endonuclease subunit R, EcoR124 family n=1 Tax=Bathymodiolus platifrons methanotrophic gill symbiont TaxID=113268 RepID=UPI001124E20B